MTLKFKESLNDLMHTLDSTTCHYVRCIKPNETKSAFLYHDQKVYDQLKACGVLETIRISAARFSFKIAYEDFIKSFRVLGNMQDKDSIKFCLSKLLKNKEAFQLGKTKIFFQSEQIAYLKMLRSEKLNSGCVIIQKWVRRWLARIKFAKLIQDQCISELIDDILASKN